MTLSRRPIARLEFSSALDMLDFVQLVSDHISRSVGLDDDALYWVGVAVRESVVNAIKHGNRNDAAKHVIVEFAMAASAETPALVIAVIDQGEGFDPEALADPLAPDNMLKSSGRGVFLMRNFMDDVEIARAPDGGMIIQMTKRLGGL